VLETVESFWKLISKGRFPKLKDFALKMDSTFGNTYTLFRFLTCESVVLCIILLEVARKLPGSCKMARRTKVVGPPVVDDDWF